MGVTSFFLRLIRGLLAQSGKVAELLNDGVGHGLDLAHNLLALRGIRMIRSEGTNKYLGRKKRNC